MSDREVFFDNGHPYQYMFEPKNDGDFLFFLRWIDSKGWNRSAYRDTWNCKFKIYFDMHE